MPSKSIKQSKFMAACAHGAGYESCPPVSVSKEFNKADQLKKAKQVAKEIKESNEKDGVKTLEHDLKEKYPELHSLYLHDRPEHIRLDTIVVKKEHRNEGIGSKVIQHIKDYADNVGKRVTLTAGVKDPHFGTTSQSRLNKFYKRQGFVENKGRNKDYSISATHYYEPKGK